MIETFERAALAAGREILAVFEAGMHVTLKADSTPVTEADQWAEAIILGILSAEIPGLPVVAEESVAAGRIPDVSSGRFILVDPLDGTREFIDRRPDFTVNIALIDGFVPVAGVVYAPAKKVAYRGSAKDAQRLTVGADFNVTGREVIRVRRAPENIMAVVSRSHFTPETETFLQENAITDSCSVGSSLKFCLLAEGKADVYPRFGRTMEWDTAAGDAVLRAAGGRTLGLDGKPLRYGKRDQTENADFANPSFVAWGGSPE
ncbi:3'(2'),5'-bisphosphate nucleotidase CysQ [Pseudomonas sp. R2.Fl]|nr:3'(2'),5'-bisphosphate nucleotidase CysQ [Pseudomonas sp. R2.Fl]